MLDLSHIPSQQQQTYTLYATGNWQTWNKPRNAKMIEIFCLGGGAGGGRGAGTNGTFTTSGGGGGASGGIVRGLIPAFLLPDTIYILVGKGGAGTTSGTANGGNGEVSYIGLQPSTSEQTLICKSSTGVATGGNSTGTGAAGTAGTISVVSLSAFGNLGLFTAIAGNIGGTATGTPSTVSALATNLVTGGGGGGFRSTTSGNPGTSILSASVILTSQVNGGAFGGTNNGDSGYGSLQPFCGTGGAGGGASLTQAGRGGNGFYGCGGAGGGAGFTNQGGNGGNGGDGLVIITVIC